MLRWLAAATVALSLLAPFGASAGTLRNSLIGYWNFDHQTLKDTSGFGHDGVVGLSFSQGVGSGYATSFSEEVGGILIPPDFFDQTQVFSISFWFNPSSVQKQRYSAMLYRANSQKSSAGSGWSDRAIAVFWIPGGLHVSYTPLDAASQFNCLGQDLGMQPDSWHHVAVTINAPQGTVTVWADGAKIATCPLSYTGLETGTYKFALGATINEQLSDSGNFTGMIDAVRYYDRVLSDFEIRSLYNGRK